MSSIALRSSLKLLSYFARTATSQDATCEPPHRSARSHRALPWLQLLRRGSSPLDNLEIESNVILTENHVARLYPYGPFDARVPCLPEWTKRIQTLTIDFESGLEQVSPVLQRNNPHEFLVRATLYHDNPSEEVGIMEPLEQLELLRTFELKIYRHHYDPQCNPSCCSYAVCGIVRELMQFNLPTLRTLDLTIENDFGSENPSPLSEENHECVAINQLLCHLHQLQQLRLRASRVCPRVLTERPPDQTLALEELLIQCSTCEEHNAFRSRSECCYPRKFGDAPKENDLDEKALHDFWSDGGMVEIAAVNA